MSDLPPPLEDCSKQVRFVRERFNKQSNTSGPISAVSKVSDNVKEPMMTGYKKAEAASTLRKGFFTNSPSTPVTVLKPNIKPNNPLLLPEVQSAMQSPMQTMLADKSWMTQELLTAIVSDPLLSQSMADPAFQDALALMQKDAKAAKAKYEKDEKVTAMLTRFMSLFGSHFETLGKKAEEPNLQSMISSDPELGKIILYMQQGGQIDPRRLPPPLFAKVKQLIDSGLLKIQT